MAPRAYWKGSLKLALVSCPVALYPAASPSPATGESGSHHRAVADRPEERAFARVSRDAHRPAIALRCRAIAYGIIYDVRTRIFRFCGALQRVVPANAGTTR